MPGGNSPVSNLPYVLLSDVPDANSLAQGLTTSLDHLVIPKYASTAARDASNVTPTEGDWCYVIGAGFYGYSGTGWVGPQSLQGGVKTFTPVWSTTTGAHTPTLGNGTSTFRYSQVGQLVFFSWDLTFGTTTNFNSGGTADNWQWTVPIAMAVAAYQSTATFTLQQTTGLDCIGRFMQQDSTHFAISIDGSRVDGTGITNPGNMDAVSPWTWGANSGNHIRGGGHYIAA